MGVVGSTDQGGDIKGNGLQVLQGLAVKVEGEILPINTGVGGAKPEETQDEGNRDEGGLYIVSDVVGKGRAAVKEGEVDEEE
ncbi:hypothetical protein C0993_011694 [Termitomyces sp. T159_Od127]|nr:hypothetical protein C0993_011694 [Termitomyces sp. T159_Od127]